jgi:hypothetical protein
MLASTCEQNFVLGHPNVCVGGEGEGEGEGEKECECVVCIYRYIVYSQMCI